MTLPNTVFWPVAFGLSVQGVSLGSQPMANSAPGPTLMSPFTVRLAVPLLNVAFSAEPGARG